MRPIRWPGRTAGAVLAIALGAGTLPAQVPDATIRRLSLHEALHLAERGSESVGIAADRRGARAG